MNWHAIAADAMVALHLAYVMFVVLGLAAIVIGAALRQAWVRNVWFRLIHLAMITVVVIEALLGIPCPLTVWEHDLRAAAGQTVEQGSFIGRLAHDLLFYDAPPWVFTAIYCLFGAVVLAAFLLAPPRWPRRGAAH